jgi:hypothetical protein
MMSGRASEILINKRFVGVNAFVRTRNQADDGKVEILHLAQRVLLRIL